MSINYSYQVVAVNESARCMEVVYSAEGYPTQHIGARLPYEGEALEDVIRMFAPVALWIEMTLPVVPPVVGQSGEIRAAEEAVPVPSSIAEQAQPAVEGAQDL